MKSILDQLADHARQRVQTAKVSISSREMRQRAFAEPQGNFPFERALRQEGLRFICECKRASPSRGLIAPVFDPLAIAREYAAAGADCISVLTEPKWFLGRDAYLQQIAAALPLPCLRKDFVVDEYQILETKVLGGAAVLLICSLLTDWELALFLDLSHQLGLTALVEAHDEAETVRAVQAGARVIGVNNRDLKNFTVDLENSLRLRELVPPDRVFVAESGVRTPEDAERMRQIGADAVLVGEALMTAPDKAAALRALRGLA